MKYLFLMGGSGTGKTTLAKNLESLKPDIYRRTRELSTRDIREGEIDGFDYKFVSKERFMEILNTDGMLEHTIYQFPPNYYGAEYTELHDDKWNVVIVCIEAFMSALENVREEDSAILVNILSDTDLDISRAGRDPKIEENVNRSVLYNLFKMREINSKVKYFELGLSYLKKIRNEPDALLEYFETITSMVDLWKDK